MKTKFKFFLLSLLFATLTLNAVPSVTSVTPSNGAIAGGNSITITGSGFTAATAVDFGFRPAVSFNVLSDTTISAIVPPGTAGTFDLIVTVATDSSLTSPLDFYTYTKSSWDGIISGINQDAITLFDTATNTINNTILLPADSLSSIMTPDGTTIYGADSDIANVNVIDAATNMIIDNIPLVTAGVGSFDLIVSPDGTRIYVSNLDSGYVTAIDTATNSVVADIFVSGALGPLAITPDGKTVYVSNFSFSNVIAIDATTNTIITGISTGVTPGSIAITPDGVTAYVANSGSDTVSIIDIATNTVTGTIIFPAGSGPYGSYILTSANTMYVANINNATVSVVDLSTNSITATIPLVAASQPFWVVATPDNKTVYVINEATDNVTPIDVATNTAGAAFANIPGDIQDIEMSPDQAPVAKFTATLQPIGMATLFDASSSISPIGTVATYAWDFGDGNTFVTTSPTVNHTYLTAGPFTVTLTVTNSAGTSTAKVFSSRFMSNNGGPQAMFSQILEINPEPPIHVRGFQKNCKKTSPIDRINVIRWKAPKTPTNLPVAYNIYRDAGLTDLIGVVPGNGRLCFEDHFRQKHVQYTYYIVSVSDIGTLSTAVSITIPKK